MAVQGALHPATEAPRNGGRGAEALVSDRTSSAFSRYACTEHFPEVCHSAPDHEVSVMRHAIQSTAQEAVAMGGDRLCPPLCAIRPGRAGVGPWRRSRRKRRGKSDPTSGSPLFRGFRSLIRSALHVPLPAAPAQAGLQNVWARRSSSARSVPNGTCSCCAAGPLCGRSAPSGVGSPAQDAGAVTSHTM